MDCVRRRRGAQHLMLSQERKAAAAWTDGVERKVGSLAMIHLPCTEGGGVRWGCGGVPVEGEGS
jgi:hypothetical protein